MTRNKAVNAACDRRSTENRRKVLGEIPPGLEMTEAYVTLMNEEKRSHPELLALVLRGFEYIERTTGQKFTYNPEIRRQVKYCAYTIHQHWDLLKDLRHNIKRDKKRLIIYEPLALDELDTNGLVIKENGTVENLFRKRRQKRSLKEPRNDFYGIHIDSSNHSSSYCSSPEEPVPQCITTVSSDQPMDPDFNDPLDFCTPSTEYFSQFDETEYFSIF